MEKLIPYILFKRMDNFNIHFQTYGLVAGNVQKTVNWQLFQTSRNCFPILEQLSISYFNIGIKHGFSCINICQVQWEVLKTEAGGRGFQHLPRDLANVIALEKHVRSLLLHKN